MAMVHPVCLQTVVLQPLASGTTSDDATHLIGWLSQSKLMMHLGSELCLPPSQKAASTTSTFKVKMMEPATCGYINVHKTRIVMVQHIPHEVNVMSQYAMLLTAYGSVSSLYENRLTLYLLFPTISFLFSIFFWLFLIHFYSFVICVIFLPVENFLDLISLPYQAIYEEFTIILV